MMRGVSIQQEILHYESLKSHLNIACARVMLVIGDTTLSEGETDNAWLYVHINRINSHFKRKQRKFKTSLHGYLFLLVIFNRFFLSIKKLLILVSRQRNLKRVENFTSCLNQVNIALFRIFYHRIFLLIKKSRTEIHCLIGSCPDWYHEG